MSPDIQETIAGPVGGTGGVEFGPFLCAPGSVGTGLTGRADGDIDQANLWCSPLTGTTLGTPMIAGGIGGAGGAEYALSCPPGSALTGVHGTAGTVPDVGVVLDTLGVQCRNLTSGALHLSPTVGIPSGTPSFALICPAGTVMTGFEGRQGIVLEGISIHCAVPW